MSQPNPKSIHVVITAGGQGTRMGTAVPKQFLDLAGKPVLYHTIKAFADAVPGINIILVLPPHQISYAQMVLQAFEERIDLTITAGGETRYHSVQNGLARLPEDSLILVHDGVRPLVSKNLILQCLAQAAQNGSAIPALTATDSMRLVQQSSIIPLNRDRVRIIQTPQTFRGSVLLPAFRQPYNESFTDEASVVEAAGGTIFLVKGEKRNLKITTPEDLAIAEALLNLEP
jgi:2-C-methyl-D-erythritol 4-phosphate cytidylyltransferase